MVGAGTVSKQGWTTLRRVEVDGHQRNHAGQPTQIAAAGKGPGHDSWTSDTHLKHERAGRTAGAVATLRSVLVCAAVQRAAAMIECHVEPASTRSSASWSQDGHRDRLDHGCSSERLAADPRS
jgi:hypothetical protein